MASLISEFPEYQVSVTLSRKTVNISSGLEQEPTWATVGVYTGLFWEGSAAQAFFSDRIKEQVSAVVALPTTVTVRAFDKIAYGTRSFNVIHADNIGAADDVLVVALEEIDNG